MNLKEEFNQSYQFCISGLNYDLIFPYTETEIQPLYSKYWYEKVITKLLDLDYIDPLNPSILRSMLVMDLIDCHYTNQDKNPIFHWYNTQLDRFYDEDIFSNNKNIPRCYQENLLDYTFFNNRNIGKKFLNDLLITCYNTFQDIYADNGYEVIGPMYQKGYTFIIYYITVNNIRYKCVLYEQGRLSGKVDMFGHMTIPFSIQSGIAIEVDTNLLDVDELPKLNIGIQNHSIKQNIQSRIDRLKYTKIYVDINEILELCHTPKNRIKDLNTLMEIVTIL